ncbi:hypothetical protein CK203_048373 [Vitis vinifera]|uniref:Uncharacterized protein n=1 Tax=Vitis vinifera TaxID=29760 RepID=A0A438HRJ2_VITVI|nr:hypothetical protein CK203_048373 [Vitis vinifera]
MSEAPQAPTIPPSEGGVPLSPRQHRYETKRPPTTLGANTSRPKKSVRRPPAKKARVASQEESSTPPQPQPPIIESQIPSGMTPEVIIRRLMRFIPPTAEIPFGAPDDSQGLLLSRVALDFYLSMTTRRVWEHIVIHLTIDGCHGILGTRHIVEALHIPYELLERRRICRELFILDKWNHLTAYVAPPRAPTMPTPLELPQDEQPPQAQQAEIPTKIIPLVPTTPSTVPMLKATSSAPPTTPETPPVVPATSAPLPSESTITISTLEFRGLCHTLQTLTTTQSIQQHLGILSPPEHDMLGPSEPTTPSQEVTPAEQTMPHEEATTVEIETPIQSTQTTIVEPLSPHDPPTTT